MLAPLDEVCDSWDGGDGYGAAGSCTICWLRPGVMVDEGRIVEQPNGPTLRFSLRFGEPLDSELSWVKASSTVSGLISLTSIALMAAIEDSAWLR